jgi:cytochrome c-type biogenesis protein CcmH
MTILYFLLGAVAMGIVMVPFLRKANGSPQTPAEPVAPATSDPAATPPGEAKLFGYPRTLVLSGGAAAVVLVAAGALYAMTGDKTPQGTVAAAVAAGGVPAPGTPPSLPDVDTLMTRLEKRLETKPNDPDGWRMLGWSYYATQKYDQAVKAYARAVALRPENAAFQSAYGEALTKASGDKVTTEAQAAFRKALATDSKDARARIYMARLRHERGDSKGAIEELFGILNTQAPDSGEALAARQAIRKVSADSGISVADRLPPEVAAPVASPLGNPAAAPATAEAGAGIPGPTAAQVQAAQQMSSGDRQSMIEGMIGKLESRLTTSPRDADGWIMLIRSRKQMGQDDKAKAALTHGLAAFADDAAARSRISDAARTYGVQ